MTGPGVPARPAPNGVRRIPLGGVTLDAADRDLCSTPGDQGHLGCSGVLVHVHTVPGCTAERHRATSLLPLVQPLTQPPYPDAVKSFEELFAELTDVSTRRSPSSGTVRALEGGVHGVGKKVVEEAAEAWMAAEHEGPQRAAEEIAQLLYHTQVLMLACGLTLDDVYANL